MLLPRNVERRQRVSRRRRQGDTSPNVAKVTDVAEC